jgi:hypothetical protein
MPKAILLGLVHIREIEISPRTSSINENSKQKGEELKFYLPLTILYSIAYPHRSMQRSSLLPEGSCLPKTVNTPDGASCHHHCVRGENS